MQLHNYQRLVDAQERGRAVRIRTLNGRVLWGRVDALAGEIDAGAVVGAVIVQTADRRAECVDLGLVLSVVVMDPPVHRAAG